MIALEVIIFIGPDPALLAIDNHNFFENRFRVLEAHHKVDGRCPACLGAVQNEGCNQRHINPCNRADSDAS